MEVLGPYGCTDHGYLRYSVRNPTIKLFDQDDQLAIEVARNFIKASEKLKDIGNIELIMSFFLIKSKQDEYWYSMEKNHLINYLSGLMKTESPFIFVNNRKAQEIISTISENPMKYMDISFGGVGENHIIYFYIKWIH